MMRVPQKTDIPHKLALYKLLAALLADQTVAQQIYFKGGTCASMLGWLDRFSVDLDFDLLDKTKKKVLRKRIHQIIKQLDFTIKDESKRHLQFFLKYRDTVNQRNTLKLEITDLVSSKNKYHKAHLIELDQYCQSQTIDTMFANKLVALIARFEQGRGIAGRDVYDIYYFINQGFDVNQAVIEDLRGVEFNTYLQEVIKFINEHISQKVLYEDLNPLLPKTKLNQVVPDLKTQVLIGLKSLAELSS